MIWINRLSWIAACLVLGGITGCVVTGAPNASKPSVVTGLHEAEDPVIVKSGMVNLTATIQTAHYCPADTQRWLWRWVPMDGEYVQQFVVLGSTIAPPSTPTGKMVFSIPVPPAVEDGVWFYRAVTIDRCPWPWMPAFLRPRIWQTQDVPISVTK